VQLKIGIPGAIRELAFLLLPIRIVTGPIGGRRKRSGCAAAMLRQFQQALLQLRGIARCRRDL
jgi:hypothetical protein